MIDIPEDELSFRASRAGGPGGQFVNKVSTRIEVRWNVRTTRALDDAQRARVIHKLASRLDGEGYLRVVASDTRSQLRNKEAARARLVEAVDKALVIPKARRPTKTPKAAKQKRLDTKRLRGQLKASRRPVRNDD